MPSTEQSWDRVGESWRDLGRHLRAEYQKLSEDQVRESQEDKDKLSEAAEPALDPIPVTRCAR